MWSTGEGNAKPLQYSCLENPMNSRKRQNDRILKEELPRLVVPNMLLEISGEISRKNEGMEPKQKQYPVVDVTGDRSKVRCCKKQYCIGTLLFTWGQTVVEVMKITSFKRYHAHTATLSAPNPATGHHQPHLCCEVR